MGQGYHIMSSFKGYKYGPTESHNMSIWSIAAKCNVKYCLLLQYLMRKWVEEQMYSVASLHLFKA